MEMNENEFTMKISDSEKEILSTLHTMTLLLTPEKKQQIFEQQLSQETRKYIRTMHLLTEVFGIAAESKIGGAIGNRFYRVDFTTKVLESHDEAKNYGNQVKEELEKAE